MPSRKQRGRPARKRHLQRAARQTKWAPFWAVLRKFGAGKRVHPSSITHVKRNWRTRKLRIKPRITKKKYLG